jgi:hypothetical protein
MIFLISLNKKEINYNVFLIQRFLFFFKKNNIILVWKVETSHIVRLELLQRFRSQASSHQVHFFAILHTIQTT